MSLPGYTNSYEDDTNYVEYQIFLDFIQTRKLGGSTAKLGSDNNHHSYKVAPLFTTKVHAYTAQHIDAVHAEVPCIYPQYGLLGSIFNHSDDLLTLQKLIFGNTSEPWSAFICGSQGSGKSHTLSCLLENALLAHSSVNTTDCPAAGIIFHYDQFSSVNSGQLCEAAYLSSAGVPVTVLVCPTSLGSMKKRYKNLLSSPDKRLNLRVKPLYLTEEQLSTEIMMTLMAVNDMSDRTPLYISSIRQLLRQMILDRPDNPVFDLKDFLYRLDQLSLTKDQLAPLSLRLDLLKSVLVDTKHSPHLRALYDQIWQPEAGSLTIVDLSDPFVTESDACALFSIALKLFVGGWQSAPRVIALDEAHKFLKSSVEAQKLTSDLISIVRQQRHLGSRVIVATQEPTVSGELLALCNVSIVHRFTSPDWYNTLRQHLAAAHGRNDDGSIFREITGLDTGQAVVFCPTAIIDVRSETGKPKMLRDAYFKLAVRPRVSADGGKSVLPASYTRFTSEHCDNDKSGIDSSRASKISYDGTNLSSDTGTSPVAMVHQMRSWTEVELEYVMYSQIRARLGPHPVKDPWPVVVSPAFKALETEFAVPERFFADSELGTGCRDRRPVDMMRRLLKRYYDELQIPRGQRAAKSWLRD